MKSVIASLVLVSFLVFPHSLLAGEVVTATGMSFFEPGREAIAREKALDEAKRAVIEQAVGTQVESRTVVEDFQVTRDQVFSRASGYIREMEIVREEKTDLGTYEVEIKARVEIAALVQDLDRFRKVLSWQKNPRVAVTVDDSLDSGTRPAARKAAAMLSRRLKSDGFRVFDADAADQMQMGLTVNVLLEMSSSESSYQGVTLNLHEVSLSTEIHRPGGELLATAQSVKSLPGANRLKVLDKGASQCVAAVWKDLRRQLTKLWEQELYSQRQIDLVMHNVTSHGQAEEIAAAIKSDVSSVADIQVLRFADNVAEFSVQYKGWPEHLTNELAMAYFKSKYFSSSLKEITGNKVVMTIN